jgi:hypothetical protein
MTLHGAAYWPEVEPQTATPPWQGWPSLRDNATSRDPDYGEDWAPGSMRFGAETNIPSILSQSQ